MPGLTRADPRGLPAWQWLTSLDWQSAQRPLRAAGKQQCSGGAKGPTGRTGFTPRTCRVIGGKYQTLQTMAQLVIILSR